MSGEKMKYVKTPDGQVYLCEECEFFNDLDYDSQNELRVELFEKEGILVSNALLQKKGGVNIGVDK